MQYTTVQIKQNTTHNAPQYSTLDTGPYPSLFTHHTHQTPSAWLQQYTTLQYTQCNAPQYSTLDTGPYLSLHTTHTRLHRLGCNNKQNTIHNALQYSTLDTGPYPSLFTHHTHQTPPAWLQQYTEHYSQCTTIQYTGYRPLSLSLSTHHTHQTPSAWLQQYTEHYSQCTTIQYTGYRPLSLSLSTHHTHQTPSAWLQQYIQNTIHNANTSQYKTVHTGPYPSLPTHHQTWDWGKVKKEENDAGVWGPQ